MELSSSIQKFLLKRGISESLVRRIAAAYEVEANVVIHSSEGDVLFYTDDE